MQALCCMSGVSISHRDKDLRGMMCNLLSCLFSNFLARVRVCDHFNTVADQHE